MTKDKFPVIIIDEFGDSLIGYIPRDCGSVIVTTDCLTAKKIQYRTKNGWDMPVAMMDYNKQLNPKPNQNKTNPNPKGDFENG